MKMKVKMKMKMISVNVYNIKDRGVSKKTPPFFILGLDPAPLTKGAGLDKLLIFCYYFALRRMQKFVHLHL